MIPTYILYYPAGYIKTFYFKNYGTEFKNKNSFNTHVSNFLSLTFPVLYYNILPHCTGTGVS